ncbi:kinesin-related protein 4-like [Pararge aegeria]|uniref:Jg2338 protein n=1 Tax=Pararge aegeria aegeria TaxID=348720 RepID=A0A8S4R8R0_9NEOP|nr:kinesin-related protein 4-like [Pararge aegeria]CAH2231680.1 jg2338 [Pararge aegeria aegeria]
MSNVKLAIRVRPFTEKEIKSEKESVPVVSVIDENTVSITNIKVSASGAGDSRERVRRFYADYTLDSACATTHPNYATQEKVFDTVGRQVLSRISQGQSACVLAYGQSATGKTHTMMGTATQPGLIPRICMALAETRPFDITVSFLEIYNERVHDLLAGEVLPVNSLPRRKGNTRKDLRVREHPTKGPYVQNLRQVAVHDVESLLTVVTEGARRRRTAATRRNTSSSRSHALLELVTPYCKLHLADLAGSEKSGWEGCGGRQKEGANINKSLVALSNVISALVSGGSGRGRFVPYRDSALTWLLKDCFTGGGSIFIIATVSPGAACYGESVSTLRWTTSARCLPIDRKLATPHILSKAVIQAQFDQLLADLANHFIIYKPDTGQLIYDDKHWELHLNKRRSVCKQEANIGNIMNFGYPQTDARNSESTPSSIASGSSDIINNMDNNAEISNEINKEIDKLFGPTLERTKSGSDIEVAAPLEHRKKQFRSQEALSNEKVLQPNQSDRLSDVDVDETNNEEHKNKEDKVPQVSILYDNQRAEIIASVTERLYSKLKKNETPNSMDPVNDKKPQNEPKAVPLNELKICSNARQRLMEISKKALKNKRRIGIPAHTQTRRFVVRVKDQGIDIQTDLQPYVSYVNQACILHQDACTETTPMTPRLKEKAVGPKYSNLNFCDRTTITENTQVIHRSLSVMTDILTTSDQCTQTPIRPHPPPPRRTTKRTSFYSKYLRKIQNTKSSMDGHNSSPIININISPVFQSDAESLSSPEINENTTEVDSEKHSKTTTPDLLTNHNNILTQMEEIEINDRDDQVIQPADEPGVENNYNIKQEAIGLDFSDEEELPLPRVAVDSSRKVGQKDYIDLILGRNDDLYPYNIKLSPTKQRDETKRVIRFKNDDVSPAKCSTEKWHTNLRKKTKSKIDKKENEYSNDSNSGSELSEMSENNSFIWNNTNTSDKGSLTVKYLDDHSEYETKQFITCLGLNNKDYSLCEKHSPLENPCWLDKSNGNEFNINKHKQYKKDNNCGRDNSFDNVEKHIEKACSSLEFSVNKYNDYLVEYKDKNNSYRSESYKPTPTKYLQHLIKLRKAAVEADRLN